MLKRIFDNIKKVYTSFTHDEISMSYDGYDDIKNEPILTTHATPKNNLMEDRSTEGLGKSDPLADLVYSVSSATTDELSTSYDKITRLIDAVNQLVGVVSGLPGAAAATAPIITSLAALKTEIEVLTTPV